MWEAVWLSVISQQTQISHEVELEDGRRPDLEFTIANGATTLNIVGDVTAVSDAGLDEQNPVEFLSDEVSRLARKQGLSPNHFHCQVEGGQTGRPRREKIQLHLPSRGEISRIINENVAPFIQSLAASNVEKDAFQYSADGVAFTVSYNKSQRYAGMGYLAYDNSISATNNPIFRALRGKAKQLSAAPAGALKMIILCDGDCATMRMGPNGGSYRSVRPAAISTEFLRQNTSIDVVVLVQVITAPMSLWRRKAEHQLTVQIVFGEFAARFDPGGLAQLEQLIEAAARTLPSPVLDSANAAIRCQQAGAGPDCIGGGEVAGDSIKISSRALHRLLAGEISQEDFFEIHRWDKPKSGSVLNPFQRLHRKGYMMTNLVIEDGGDLDDDWITFTFGRRDSAAGPFVARADAAPSPEMGSVDERTS